ncbi:acylamino-acid-releasing enzyme-like isoform X2 [Ostrea edulis]|uniref:acylamino-acid-releasing enzyme-like isoform X2 n=1 Tax=Ostrea edulis TaxID=37623 RepID=UPI0024AEB30D|nr:acylamino-acid-releasing enzyme-like isoform X2 [Ostrea edulis]
MNAKLTSAIEVYRRLVSHPEPVVAWFSYNGIQNQIAVNSIWNQSDLDRLEKVKFTKSYVVTENSPAKFEVIHRKISTTDNDVMYNEEAPSGKFNAIIRKFTPKKGGEEKQFIEIWNHCKKIKQFDVLGKEKHGKICTKDGQFGSLHWSKDETKLLYVAERKPPKMVSFFDTKAGEKTDGEPPVRGHEHDFKQDWGEQLISKHNLALNVLDLESGDINTLDTIPSDLSVGQAIWTPKDELVFVGWKQEPYRLGLTYCPIRKSAIYLLDLKTSTIKQLSEENRASWLPRLSPDGSKLIYLDNAIGGPHYQCSRLMMCDMKTGKLTVLVDIVKDPKGDDCPGVYSMSLPQRCWTSDGKRVFINSVWRRQLGVLVVNTETGKITPILSESHTCLRVTDVIDNRLLVLHSSINQLPYFSICRLPESGQESTAVFQPLDDPEPSLDINFEVLKFLPTNRPHPKVGTLEYEGILVTPKNGKDKHPLIVFPHGGPHSVFTTDFKLFPAVFTLSGFAVIYINYRGSIGYGDNSLRSLPGNVGDMDVKDCQEVAESVVKLDQIDESKVAVFGGSHGGFLTTHLIGQYPEFYKVACCRNPVTNIASMMPESDIPDWCHTESGFEFTYDSLTTGEKLTEMWKKSPLQYVDKVQAPLLIMLGLDDARVPPKQGEEYYKQMKARNKKCRLIGYKDNCHPIDKVEASADACINVLDWFWQHLD